jgi:hypothetical protein
VSSYLIRRNDGISDGFAGTMFEAGEIPQLGKQKHQTAASPAHPCKARQSLNQGIRG